MALQQLPRRGSGSDPIELVRRSLLDLESPANWVPAVPPFSDRLWPKAPAALALKQRYRNLRRHFIFEYYPWYRQDPWEHWPQFDRVPPLDIASSMMPVLGAYDSLNPAVVEQHAEWIAGTGVGAVNLSWWGRGSTTDKAVHLVMDVMRAHDIHVAFHIEPYSNDRALHFYEDIAYILREYGERRRWDAFLMLENADGVAAPVFKVFRSILPRTVTDCLGRTTEVEDYAADSVWRMQIDAIRAHVAGTFPVTLLADSLDRKRTLDSGFDGIAIYDNFVTPDIWPEVAKAFDVENLLVSFNIHAGFDVIEPRSELGPCYEPAPVSPPVGPVAWARQDERERVAIANDLRIADTCVTTTALQADESLSNWRKGVFLVYINSFNEWHEGTSFEPAKHWKQLTREEVAIGYHNPNNGFRRLRTLEGLLNNFLR